MKAYLVFKLPEESEEFKLAQDAGKYSAALSELDNFLRNKVKHENQNYMRIDNVRKKLHEILDQYGVEV